MSYCLGQRIREVDSRMCLPSCLSTDRSKATYDTMILDERMSLFLCYEPSVSRSLR